MTGQVTTSALVELFGVSKQTISELGKRGIIEKGTKRGTWLLLPSVSGYVKHLREEATARGGEAAEDDRTKLGEAQADLAATTAAKMRGELVEAAAVEKLWITKMKAFRARIHGIPQRVQYLSARQSVVLQQELRAALDELFDDKAA